MGAKKEEPFAAGASRRGRKRKRCKRERERERARGKKSADSMELISAKRSIDRIEAQAFGVIVLVVVVAVVAVANIVRVGRRCRRLRVDCSRAALGRRLSWARKVLRAKRPFFGPACSAKEGAKWAQKSADAFM